MSEVDFNVNAVARDVTGKADIRRLRRTGGVPGVIYGGNSEPVSITLRQNEMVRHLQDDAFYSHILNIEVDGKGERVILKDLQRHPFRLDILHVDFMRVVKGQKLTVTVPLHFINEEKSVGLQEGGVAQHVIQEIEIAVLPKNLPEFIEVDMAAIAIGGSVHLSDLVMPEGAELLSLAHGGDDLTVANIAQPRQEVAEDEDTAAPEASEVPAANQKDPEG